VAAGFQPAVHRHSGLPDARRQVAAGLQPAVYRRSGLPDARRQVAAGLQPAVYRRSGLPKPSRRTLTPVHEQPAIAGSVAFGAHLPQPRQQWTDLSQALQSLPILITELALRPSSDAATSRPAG
jgi:hypothetical protein